MKKTEFKPTLIELIDSIVSSIKSASTITDKYCLEKGLQDLLEQEFNDDNLNLSINLIKSSRTTIYGCLKASGQHYFIEVYPKFNGTIEINSNMKNIDLTNQVKGLLLKRL